MYLFLSQATILYVTPTDLLFSDMAASPRNNFASKSCFVYPKGKKEMCLETNQLIKQFRAGLCSRIRNPSFTN